VKVYAGMDPRLPLAEVGAFAARIEALGYDGLHVAETVHDSLAVSLLALEHTTTLTVRTAVTLTFVRSPMLTALSAWDLAAFSNGRFQLGLGTQIRQNIEERFGAPWPSPVRGMADHVGAIRACFEAFAGGGALDFTSETVSLTRLQDYFRPAASGVTPPPIWLGGVNAKMTALAGELADGFVTHPTNSSVRFVAERCLPSLSAGLARSGRTRDDLEIVVGTQVITGATRADLEAEKERQRRLFAFLYSTPAYAPTLDLYGWTDLGAQLRAAIKADDLHGLHHLVTDEILDTLIPICAVEELPAILLDRYAGLCDGLLLSVPADPALDRSLAAAIAALQAAS
jgi:probable F420-dependent oxidoreductase